MRKQTGLMTGILMFTVVLGFVVPCVGGAATQALLWQDGYRGPTKVVIEGKASCIRVKWTGSRGPCAPDYVTNPTEELFFTDLPQRTAWPVSAADPKKRFPNLEVGDAVVKTMHADNDCDQTFWMDGVVSAREECLSVRFSAQPKEDKVTAPYAAADLIPVPPGAEQRGKLGFDEVKRVIKTHRGDVEDCLRANNIQYDTSWAVSLAWIISPDGAVIRPRIENPNESNAALGECLLERVSQWRFPESAEGMRILNFRFNRFNPRWE